MRKRKGPLALLLALALCAGMLTAPAGAAVTDSALQTAYPAESQAARIASLHPKVTLDGKTFQVSAQVSGFNAQLTITADGLSGSRYYAAVMDAKTYVDVLGQDPKKMTKDRFQSPAGAGITDKTHYLARFAETDKFSTNGTALTASMGTLKGLSLTNTGTATAGDNGTAYYRSYVFIVLSDQLGGNSAENYAVGTFLIDNEGNLLDKTWLLRYQQNQAANDRAAAQAPVTGTMPPQLTAQNTAATVANTAFARKGYEFKGWDARKDLYQKWRGGSGGDQRYVYRAWADIASADKPKFQTLPSLLNYDASYAYKIADLYAQWYPVSVAFHAEAATLPKSDSQPLKVGAPYEQAYTLAAGSPDTTKSYTVRGTPALPPGLNVVRDGNLGWKITGTPTVYNPNQCTVTLRVTDDVNGTFDQIELTIPAIDKGDLPVKPDLDVSTGLESNVLVIQPEPDPGPDEGGGEEIPDEGGGTEPAAEPVRDGVLFGFYSLGQHIPEEEGGHPKADGSGSLRPYYLDIKKNGGGTWNEALVYEYKPDGEAYTEWREIPLPRSVYESEPLTGGTLADVEAAMAAGADTRAASSYTGAGVALTVAGEQTPWADEYGRVEFDDDGNPVLHGLTEGGAYLVRFKENEDFGHSDYQTVVITSGGGASGPADPSDFVTVVCYDWDDTLLGSVTVPKRATAAQVQPYLDAFVASLMSPDSKDVDEAKENHFVDDPAYPLTNKMGYSFDLWLDYNSTYPTHWGRGMDAFNVNNVLPRPSGNGVASFDNLDQNITVKACYAPNDELLYLDTEIESNKMFYTVDVVKYDRIGNSVNYPITVAVYRRNNDETNNTVKGVPRLVQPILKVEMKLGNSTILSYFTLKNSDVATVEFVPTSAVTSISCSVVDFYGPTIRSTASAKTEIFKIESGTNSIENAGFLLYGSQTFIDQQVRLNDSTAINANVLKNQGGLTFTVSNSVAFSYLRAAWEKKNSLDGTGTTLKPESEWVDLSFGEKQFAVQHSGAWPVV